jgi:hypothetical protein
LLLKGVIPLAGALVLTLAFLKSAWEMRKADYGYTSFHGIGGVFLLGVGTLVVGVLVMLGYAAARPGFFRGEHGPGEVPPPQLRTDVAAGPATSGTLG